MAKSEKREKTEKRKKSAQELHELTTDELMRHVFGAKGHKVLQQHVLEHDAKPKKKTQS